MSRVRRRRTREVLLAALLAISGAAKARSAEAPTVKVWACCDVLTPFLDGQPHHRLSGTPASRWVLYRITRELYDSLPGEVRARTILVSDIVELPALSWDTYHEVLDVPPEATATPEGDAFFLVQPYGYEGWGYDFLRRVRNGATTWWPFSTPRELRWTTPAEREGARSAVFAPSLFSLPEASAPAAAVQFAGPLHPFFKIDRNLDRASTTALEVEVWAIRRPDSSDLLRRLEANAVQPLDVRESAQLLVVRTATEGSKLENVAREPEVLWVRRPPEITFHDPLEPCSWQQRGPYVTATVPTELLPRLAGDVEVYQEGSSTRSSPRAKVRLTTAALDALEPRDRGEVELSPDLLWMAAHAGCVPGFDTRGGSLPASDPIFVRPDGNALRVVQFLVPNPPRRWYDRVREAGASVAGSLAERGWLVWASEETAETLRLQVAPPSLFSQPSASDAARIFSFAGDLLPVWKVAPELLAPGPRFRRAVVSVWRNPGARQTESLVRTYAAGDLLVRDELAFVRWNSWLDVAAIRLLARQPDVVGVTAPGAIEDRWASPGPLRVSAPAGLLDPAAPEVQQLPTGGSGSRIFRIARSILDDLTLQQRGSVRLLSDRIFLPGLHFDAFNGPIAIPDGLRLEPVERELWLLQTVDRAPPEWREALEARGAAIVTEFDTNVLLAWIDRTDVSGVRELMAPAPFVELPDSDPPHFLQFVEPLHTAFRLPVWAFTGGTPVLDELDVLLADDGTGNEATRAVLEQRYGPARWEGSWAGLPMLVFYPLAAGGPTPEELVLLAERSDVVFAGDYFATGQGPSGFVPPDTSPGLPGSPGDPNAVATPIPASSPAARLVLVAVLGLLGLAAARRA